MISAPSSVEDRRLQLKEPSGWFAAGTTFRSALTALSDGAFKLFAYFCLVANRHTGRLEATQKELATVLGKSKRSIGLYIDELQVHQICRVVPAKNQYGRTVFEITDAYWPYHRIDPNQPSGEELYVDSVRQCFLSLGCASKTFSEADKQIASQLYQRRVPLTVIENALLLGACRKYISWLNRLPSPPIQSLRYFDPIIAEIQKQSLPPGYAAYLRRKIQELTEANKNGLTEPAQDPACLTTFGVLVQKSNQQNSETDETS